ncbi:hypothetical protein LY78DRAFT_118521 [Colletotrichum sublineola]|nr:hypothetical protein LY78DRAFT_118521 [Colletotrichum sublineola]
MDDVDGTVHHTTPHHLAPSPRTRVLFRPCRAHRPLDLPRWAHTSTPSTAPWSRSVLGRCKFAAPSEGLKQSLPEKPRSV